MTAAPARPTRLGLIAGGVAVALLLLGVSFAVEGALGAAARSAPVAPSMRLTAAVESGGCSPGAACLTHMIWGETVYNAAGQPVSYRAAGAPVIGECSFWRGGQLEDDLGSSLEFGEQYVADAGLWTGSAGQVLPTCGG